MATPQTPPPSQPRLAPADGLDPDVKMPKAIRAAAERAHKLYEENKDGAPAGDPPAGDPPAGDPKGTITISDAPPPATPPAGDPPAAVPPAEIIPPVQGGGDTVSRADFLAMKGRFEKANANNLRLSDEIANLRNLVTQLSVAAPPAPPPAELTPQSLLTPQEIADYGPEFIDLVGRKAREVAGAEVAQLKAQIEQLTRGVQASAAQSHQSARETLFATLDRELPEWRTQNTQPEFLDWLGLPDMFSGAIRGDLLKTAFEQNNAPRVLAFFKGFLTEEAATTPATPTPPVPPNKVPLETFAAPGRAKSAAAAAPAEKPIITRAQVTQFYLDAAAGKYRGREALKAQLEAEIFAATNEGRLQ